MCATATPLTATISSSMHSWQSSAGLPAEGRTGVGKVKRGENKDSQTWKHHVWFFLARTEKQAAVCWGRRCRSELKSRPVYQNYIAASKWDPLSHLIKYSWLSFKSLVTFCSFTHVQRTHTRRNRKNTCVTNSLFMYASIRNLLWLSDSVKDLFQHKKSNFFAHPTHMRSCFVSTLDKLPQ